LDKEKYGRVSGMKGYDEERDDSPNITLAVKLMKSLSLSVLFNTKAWTLLLSYFYVI
jgi:hypothetical protein